MAALAPSPPPAPAVEPLQAGGAMGSGAQALGEPARAEEAAGALSASPGSQGPLQAAQTQGGGPSREAAPAQGESPGEQTHAYFSEQVLAAGILELHQMPGLPQAGPKYKCAGPGRRPTRCPACPPPGPSLTLQASSQMRHTGRAESSAGVWW